MPGGVSAGKKATPSHNLWGAVTPRIREKGENLLLRQSKRCEGEQYAGETSGRWPGRRKVRIKKGLKEKKKKKKRGRNWTIGEKVPPSKKIRLGEKGNTLHKKIITSPLEETHDERWYQNRGGTNLGQSRRGKIHRGVMGGCKVKTMTKPKFRKK